MARKRRFSKRGFGNAPGNTNWSTTMMFTNLGLTPAILRALATLGHDTPTPIQQQAIPLVLEGHDLR